MRSCAVGAKHFKRNRILTLAYLLARQGKTVTILEASETVGGISQTARYKDYRFDIGGHRFFTKIAPVQSFWEDMLGDELIDVPRFSRILYNGTFFDYPLKAMNALTGLGPVNAIRILGSYCWAKVRPSKVEAEPVNENETIRMNVYCAMTTVCASARLM